MSLPAHHLADVYASLRGWPQWTLKGRVPRRTRILSVSVCVIMPEQGGHAQTGPPPRPNWASVPSCLLVSPRAPELGTRWCLCLVNAQTLNTGSLPGQQTLAHTLRAATLFNDNDPREPGGSVG